MCQIVITAVFLGLMAVPALQADDTSRKVELQKPKEQEPRREP